MGCLSVLCHLPGAFAESGKTRTQADLIRSCLDLGANAEAGVAGLRQSLEDCKQARAARYVDHNRATPAAAGGTAPAAETGTPGASAEAAPDTTNKSEPGNETATTPPAGKPTPGTSGADRSASTDAAVDAALAKRAKTIPVACLQRLDDKGNKVDSDWCFTLAAFVGLTRVDLRSGGDRFQPLAGVASGVKLRKMHVAPDGVTNELIGFNLGLYYEPRANNAVMNTMTGTVGTTNVQTLSGLFTVSTFENLYLGVGYRFASEAADFRRADHHNFLLVFGLGVDGNSTTPAP